MVFANLLRLQSAISRASVECRTAMKLAPASWELVPQILEILKTNFPHSKNTYNKLNGQYYLLKTFNEPSTTLLTPDGKLDQYGTYLFIIPSYSEIHIETLNPNWESFAEAIANCHYIDWTLSPMFCSTHVRLNPIIDNVENRLPKNSRITYPTHSFHITKEKALKLPIQIPDDLDLRSLTLDHAETVNNLWPHGKTERSLIIVRDFISKRPSVGLFKKGSNELMAWCLYGEYGGPAVLQVKEEYMRKGYGEIALRFITVRSAETGLDPHAYILPKNEASKALFRKLGYEEKYPAAWELFQHKSAKDEKL